MHLNPFQYAGPFAPRDASLAVERQVFSPRPAGPPAGQDAQVVLSRQVFGVRAALPEGLAYLDRPNTFFAAPQTFFIGPGYSGASGLVVYGSTGLNLQQWGASAASPTMAIDNAGNLKGLGAEIFFAADTTTAYNGYGIGRFGGSLFFLSGSVGFLWGNNSNTQNLMFLTNGGLLGLYTTSPGGMTHWVCQSAGTVGNVTEGAASQTATLSRLDGVSSVQVRPMADQDARWVDSTDATRKAAAVRRAYDTAARETDRGWADGAAGRFACAAPASAPADAQLPASEITFYLDEVGNNLKVRVRYSDGTTLKTGTIALV